MTFREWQKLLDREQSAATEKEDSPAMRQLINKCYNVPFYHWGKVSHHKADPNLVCNCFNKIIGLPIKGGKEYPLFDYEYMIFRALIEAAFLNTRNATDDEYKKF